MKLLNCVFTVSADVAVVAESLDATDSMLRQILDGLLQPISFDVRDRELLISCVLCRHRVNVIGICHVARNAPLTHLRTVLMTSFHVSLV